MLFKGGVDHQFGEHLLVRTSAFYVRDELRINEVPFADSPFRRDRSYSRRDARQQLEAVYTWNPVLRTLVGFEFLDRGSIRRRIRRYAPPAA